MDTKLITVGLCGPGRHEMPVSEYIFPAIVQNPMDFDDMYAQAQGYLTQLQFENETPLHMMLFVTGLTPVLTSFLSVWNDTARPDNVLTLMHFNRDTSSYEPQDF